MIDWLRKNASSFWVIAARRYGAWIVVAFAVLLTLGVRWRLRDMPLERDEGEYAYAGQLMLQGIAPYKAMYSQKLPGTFAAYAVFMAVFGQNASAIHVGVALVNAASVILIFFLGRRLLDDVAAAASAVSFALLALNPWVLGLAGHATHFVVLAALAAILVLLRACDASSTRGDGRSPSSNHNLVFAFFRHPSTLYVLSGLLFGLAFLMKQHGIFFGIFGGVYLLWRRAGDWLTGRLVEVPLQSARSRSSRADSGEQRRRALIPSRRGRLRPDLRTPGRLKGEVLRVLRDEGLLAGGFLLPYAVVCLTLAGAGAFHQFLFWTVSYAGKYSSAIPLVKGSDVVRAAVNAVVGPNLVLWILPWLGALMMWWETRLDDGSEKLEASPHRQADIGGPWSLASTPAPGFHAAPTEDEGERGHFSHRASLYSSIRYPRFFLMALLLCSIASVSVGLYFRAHYFILLLPVLALLTGVAVSRAVYLLRHDRTIELFLALPILAAFVIAIGAALIGNGSTWFAMTPAQAMTSVYGSTLFSETAAVAQYLKENAPPDARVAVLGSEPEIYFYSRRHAVTGYIYMYPLMEQHDFALKMQEEMIGEIERARPEYLVYVDDDYSWLPRPDSNRKILEWWKDYWATDLDLVKTIEFQEGLDRGADAESPGSRGLIRSAAGSTGAQGHILILKRKK